MKALIIPAVVVLVIDQITKHWVRFSMDYHRYDIIDGWLAINYTVNPGMAMGMNWLPTSAISSVAILATIGILIYVLKTMDQSNFAYIICMGLILGGATGNIVDRLFLGIIEGYGGLLNGHVIDFIHFNLTIKGTPVFPYIFNVADMAISTSIITMLVFYQKIMPTGDGEEEPLQEEKEVKETLLDSNNGS